MINVTIIPTEETRVQIQSLRGPQGIPGPQGPRGEKGEDGSIKFDELTPEQMEVLRGPAGKTGPQGPAGANGKDGSDGVSPSVTFERIEGGYRLTIVDATGTHNAEIMDGTDGLQGPAGPQGIQGPSGERGEQGERGAPFAIAKIYSSIANMNAGYASDGVAVGGFVLIETGDVSDEENARLYVKGESRYEYVTDLSGAPGIQGPEGKQGPQGPAGKPGAAGADGKDGTSVTIKSVSESSADGGSNVVTFSDGKTVTIKNGKTGAQGPMGPTGEIGPAGPTGPAGADGKDGAQGPAGPAGPAGSDATVTAANIQAALGYKPASEAAVSQLSEKIAANTAALNEIGTQEDIVQQVIAALGTPVFGRVEDDKDIILTATNLAKGTYTYYFEDRDGTRRLIGTDTVEGEPTYTNVLPLAIGSDGKPYNGGKGYKNDTRLGSSGSESTSSATGLEVTGFIPVKNGDIVYLNGITLNTTDSADKCYLWAYDASFAPIYNRYSNMSGIYDLDTMLKNGIVEQDSEGNFTKITVGNNHMFITGASQGDINEISYIRFSAAEINAESIITINEPIE